MVPPRARTDSIELLRLDHSQLAANISNLTNELSDVKKVQADHREMHAVAKEREKNIDEKLDDIKGQIAGIYGLAKIFFVAFVSVSMAAIVTFVVRGGLNVPNP